jgi:amino acid transporter
MEWLYFISYFFGGIFLSNAIPHFVSGVMGRPFQSPFAKPPGQGLSSSTVNVLWGVFNFVVSYVLICRVGEFSLRSTTYVAVLGLGFLVIGLVGARHFGRFHGGNSPAESNAKSG